jgi:PAS domain S-box-containing protein
MYKGEAMVLQGKIPKRVLRLIFLIVLPLALVCFTLFLGYEHSLLAQASLRLQAEQQKGNLIITNQIESVFSQYVSDLLVVYNSNEFSGYIQDPNEGTLLQLARLFIRITNQKEYIYHQRFIGTEGKELIQVDRNPGGLITLVGEDQLEDLHQFELFQYTRNLAPRVLYISKVATERNADGSEKSIITLALPAYRGSVFMGIVAIDFDACQMLSFLGAYQGTLDKDLGFTLVDQLGWVVLAGADSCSALYASYRNLFSEVSKLQAALYDSDQGSVTVDHTVYAYQAVYPRTSERLSRAPGHVRLWTLVSSYDIADVPHLTHEFLLSHGSVKYIITLLVLVLGSLLVIFYQVRAGDKQQMRISSLIADYATDGIVVCDAQQKITFCNQAFEHLSGYKQNELIGRSSHRLRQDLQVVARTRHQEEVHPAWVFHRSGNRFLTSLSIIHLFTREKKLEYSVEVYSPSVWTPADISELCELSNHDPSQCFSSVFTLLSYKTTVSCLCFKVQNSKELGMQLNQIERARFSQNLAQTLANLLDSTIGVYAFSFDSYFVFLKDSGLDQVLSKKIQGLMKAFQEPFNTFDIRLDCGVSNYPSTSSNVFDLLVDAYLASQMVEKLKDGLYVFYTSEVKKQYQRHTAIRQALATVFKSDQMRLFYQAQLSIEKGTIIGAEALIRWEHPTLGSIRPDEFLPILQEQQQLDQLGRFVITESIQFLSRNLAFLQATCPAFSLSINLSPEEFSNPSLIDLLGSLLREHRIPDNYLTVELTEHTAVENLTSANATLDKLHAQGIAIAIDDFGTGFSSLSYLMELSIDMIKIDRSFISRYPDSESVTIYKTVLLLAKEVGATVLAEGVEKAEQLAFLSEIGCDQYQGYLFSKAVDETTFLKQIEEVNIQT